MSVVDHAVYLFILEIGLNTDKRLKPIEFISSGVF